VSRSIRRRDVSAAALASLPDTLHPVLRRIYAARRVIGDELAPSLARLIPVGELGAAQVAAAALAEARARGERVAIIGDFDADGATASALCVSCLRAMGFPDVIYLVPDRFRFGYGLSPAIAELAADRGADLLVTVDNGVSSIAGVLRARELGMRVIVTDHHLPGRELPAADVLVNPNLRDETFPGKNLAGVGVAFYVMAALGRELAAAGLLPEAEALAPVTAALDLVALGTVADLVPLDFNNRVLVAEGLRRIRAGRCRPGLQALFEMAGRDWRRAVSTDLAFAIAPRLNAAGRLTDMSLGIDCLLAESPEVAREMAGRLDELNRERRELQARMELEAAEHIEAAARAAAGSNADASVFCLSDERWHEGVVGLVATRVKDQVARPVIAFAPAEVPGMLKGSARSIPGIHIRDAIDAVAAGHPGLVSKFGGHAMAAGLTLAAADLEQFRAALEAEVARHIGSLERPDVIWSDGELRPGEHGLELAEALAAGGPWGQGFPEPTFDDRLEILEHRWLRERHLKLRVRHPDGGPVLDAIAFNQAGLPASVLEGAARFVYRLDVNEYRGRRTPQLVVEHLQCD
jgi:single-stranded-DNA-specific exonuclease